MAPGKNAVRDRAAPRRGHILARASQRGRRELQRLCTELVLGITRPRSRTAAIATLTPDEENASVSAVQLAAAEPNLQLTLLSPDPAVARGAVAAAARTLELPLPANITYPRLRFAALLRAFARAERSYSTHVLLPGRDRSGRRQHVHLSHGSGPKPDTTFRGPATALASITPHWIPHQLREYRLPADTEIVPEQPRLAVMRAAMGDPTVQARLGLAPTARLLVWAPTYRVVRRAGGELRVSGTPLTEHAGAGAGFALRDLIDTARDHGWHVVAKVHPHDAAELGEIGIPALTNEALRAHGVTPYELFGAAGLVVTDYSSVYVERAHLGLPYALFCPDLTEFAESYRGFRDPLPSEFGPDSPHRVTTAAEFTALLASIEHAPPAPLGATE